MFDLGQKVRVVDTENMNTELWPKGTVGRFLPFEYLPATIQAGPEGIKFAFNIIDGAIASEEGFSITHSKQLEKVADLVDVDADENELKFGKVFSIKTSAGEVKKGMIQTIDEDGNIRAVIESAGYVRITPAEYEEHSVK